MLFRSLAAFLFAGLLVAQTPTRMTPAQAAEIEKTLETKPDDSAARLRLLAYYSLVGAKDAGTVKLPRRRHIVWLIEHDPANPMLSSAMAALEPSGQSMADPEGYQLAAAAWRKHFEGNPPPAAVYANAIQFFETSDVAYASKLAAYGLKRYPDADDLAARVGRLFALTILGAKGMDRFDRVLVFDEEIAKSDAAQVARRELETASNAGVLAGAGQTLNSQALPLRIRGREKQANEVAALAQTYLDRALKLAPLNPKANSAMRLALQSRASAERDVAKKAALLERAVSLPGEPRERWYLLDDLAKAWFATGALAKASEPATALLNDAPKYPNDWNNGNAIHWGNIVLGRIALKEDKLDEACRRLLAAGATKGSPQLDSFGPDWDLARELVNRGQTKPVLEYIDLCRKFWKLDRGALDYWASAIRDGAVPSFSRAEASNGGRGPEASVKQLVGKPAPPFELKDLAGTKVSIADFKGKVVLLDFWATWCAPCRQEMPALEKLHREYAGNDVVVLAVDADEEESIPAAYVRTEKLTLPVLIAAGTDMVSRYGVVAFPTTLAIDAEGRVAAYVVGDRDEAGLRDLIAKAKK